MTNKQPIIIVLGASGLDTAHKIAGEFRDSVIHGYAKRVPTADVVFDEPIEHIRSCFENGHTIIGVCASGILIRAVAPALQDKRVEPPVLAVAEDGSSVVPLLGGHHGANDLAQRLADKLTGHAALTTAGDVRLGIALDAPPAGWTLVNPEDAKDVTARLLSGEAVEIDEDLDWIDRTSLNISDEADLKLTATIAARGPQPGELIYHPRKVVVGVGSDRGCPAEDLISLVSDQLQKSHIATDAIAFIVSLDRKADEPAMHALGEYLRAPVRFVNAETINTIAARIPNPSDVVMREVGVPGVAEGAALVASGAQTLQVEKTKSARCTCAIAIAQNTVDPYTVGRPRGHLSVIGIGPGQKEWRSGEAERLLREASDWVGYGLYLDLVADLKAVQEEHRFDLGAEELRVRHALELAGKGRDVALICSGDAGIYAMAALVFEVLALEPSDGGLDDASRRVAITVAPGISAIQAAAARAGAPIGHDFCLISLSDLLTPWSVIEKRVEAAAAGDFVVGFYNPRSMRRREQLDKAIAILRQSRPADTPVIIASNLGRPAEKHSVVPLCDFDPEQVDMLSIVVVGASTTRSFATGDGQTHVFTPRGYAAKRTAEAAE
ncbi:MAG: precorrin-3B C(17)-methyltransferase [Pseudomonadota bacterium]